MAKYLTALCLTAMAVTIAVIDARSTDVAGRQRGGASGTERAKTIYAAGIVEGATEDIKLNAEQFGRVQEVLVAEGQWVNAGDVLMRFDNQRQQQEVALASARLELARAELERLQNGARAEEREEAAALAHAAQTRVDQAVRNLELFQNLRTNRAITKQETDDQQSLVDTSRSELEAVQARFKQIEAPARADELRAAEARVTAAEAELKLANIGLAKTELRAPSRGCVLDVDVEPGELTGPEASQPLVVLCDISSIRVRAYVEELDAARVRAGMPARVSTDSLPNVCFTGKVISISPRMIPKQLQRGVAAELYDVMNREVVIELPKAKSLPVGLRVDVILQEQGVERPGKT